MAVLKPALNRAAITNEDLQLPHKCRYYSYRKMSWIRHAECSEALTPPRRPHAGFTLIELLTTVGIVAILAALMIPMVQNSIEAARSSGCLTNLRQIGVASAAYVSENDGAVVPSSLTVSGVTLPVRWRAFLQPYIPSRDMKTFICPSYLIDAKYMQTNDLNFRVTTGLQPCSYDINSYYNSATGLVPPGVHDTFNGYQNLHRKLAAVPNQSRNIYIFDIGIPDSISVPYPQWTETGRSRLAACFGSLMPNLWTARNWCIYPRHKKGSIVNALYYDGHVASLNFARDIVNSPPGNENCVYDFQAGFK